MYKVTCTFSPLPSVPSEHPAIPTPGARFSSLPLLCYHCPWPVPQHLLPGPRRCHPTALLASPICGFPPHTAATGYVCKTHIWLCPSLNFQLFPNVHSMKFKSISRATQPLFFCLIPLCIRCNLAHC